MGEGEQKLCLVEPTLELGEETPLQVQMQLMEAMEDGEALVAEEEAEAGADTDTVQGLPHLLCQEQMEQMEEVAELVVMEAAAVAEAEAVVVIFIAPI